MRQLRQALINAGCTSSMFKKFKSKKPVHPVTEKPLVIATNVKAVHNDHGQVMLVKCKEHVQKVSHITGMGGNAYAVTEGGDMWKFKNEGNNFLRAIR